MDVEFLDGELEVIDLGEPAVPASGAPADEAAADAVFMTWFTDWRRRAEEPARGAD